MALTIQFNGRAAQNLIKASWWNDYYYLLTGDSTMSDQSVSFRQNLNLKGLGQAPASGMSAAAMAGAGTGIGLYYYTVTFYHADGGETPAAPTISVTTTTGNQQVALSAIPTGPAGTKGRNIYRTVVGGGGFFKYNFHIADNVTTSITDSSSDGGLTTQKPPANNSFGGSVLIEDSTGATNAQITNDGNASLAGTLGVVGATTIAGAVSLASTLSVTGAITTAGAFTANNTFTTTNGNISSTGNLILNAATGSGLYLRINNVSVAYITGTTFTTVGNCAVGNNFSVAGGTTLTGQLNMNSPISTTDGNLTSTGNLILNSAAGSAVYIRVNGTSAAYADNTGLTTVLALTCGTALTVTTSATVGTTLTVSGTGTSSIVGPVTLNSNGSGTCIIGNDLQVNGIIQAHSGQGLVYNVPTGQKHSFEVNASEVVKLDAAGITLISGKINLLHGTLNRISIGTINVPTNTTGSLLGVSHSLGATPTLVLIQGVKNNSSNDTYNTGNYTSTTFDVYYTNSSAQSSSPFFIAIGT